PLQETDREHHRDQRQQQAPAPAPERVLVEATVEPAQQGAIPAVIADGGGKPGRQMPEHQGNHYREQGGEHGLILAPAGGGDRPPPRPCPRSISQREIEMVGESSSPSGSDSPRRAAPTSSRLNQRASSSSSLRHCGTSGAASASKPSISDDGNGHGCEAR